MALAASVMPLSSARPMSTPPARRSWRVSAAKAPMEASSATTAKNTHWYRTFSSAVRAPASSSRLANRTLNATSAAPSPIPDRRAWPSHRRPRRATGGALWSLPTGFISSVHHSLRREGPHGSHTSGRRVGRTPGPRACGLGYARSTSDLTSAGESEVGRARPVQLGMIGLGRMGANLVRRLMRHGHECVVYDHTPDHVHAMEDEGVTGALSLDEFVSKLVPPRAAWIMIPAAYVGDTVDQLAALVAPGDIIIDGGNSYYRDDIERSEALRPQGIHYLDVGTSGGVVGPERGFCLMIGGDDEPVAHLDPIFPAIAPGVQAAPPTPRRTGPPPQEEKGYLDPQSPTLNSSH